MNRYTWLLACIITTIIACTKKAVPTITARTTEPPPPATATVDVIPDTEAGKSIFTTRCGRCHGLPEPSKYPAQKWQPILASMMPKARLNKEQEIHLRAYINENAAKYGKTTQ